MSERSELLPQVFDWEFLAEKAQREGLRRTIRTCWDDIKSMSRQKTYVKKVDDGMGWSHKVTLQIRRTQNHTIGSLFYHYNNQRANTQEVVIIKTREEAEGALYTHVGLSLVTKGDNSLITENTAVSDPTGKIIFLGRDIAPLHPLPLPVNGNKEMEEMVARNLNLAHNGTTLDMQQSANILLENINTSNPQRPLSMLVFKNTTQ